MPRIIYPNFTEKLSSAYYVSGVAQYLILLFKPLKNSIAFWFLGQYLMEIVGNVIVGRYFEC